MMPTFICLRGLAFILSSYSFSYLAIGGSVLKSNPEKLSFLNEVLKEEEFSNEDE